MAGTTSSGNRGRGQIVGINVTPMVDVVLVLLVIMMVSSTYIVSQSLKVNLPTSASSDGAPPATAIVSISPEGTFRFNGDEIDEPALIAALVAARAESADLTVVISADREAQHGMVVHVMDLARQQNITSFAVQVERSAAPQGQP
jgi:biopolymer transport protein ExbD